MNYNNLTPQQKEAASSIEKVFINHASLHVYDFIVALIFIISKYLPNFNKDRKVKNGKTT